MGQRIIVSEEEKKQILERYQIITEQSWLDKAQQIADYAGIIPVIGDAVDVINAVVYFGRAVEQGKFHPHGVNGLLSLIGVIPVAGSAVSLTLRTIFKGLPVNATTDIVRKLASSNGDDAASTLVRASSTSPEAMRLLQTLSKNKAAVSRGVKMIVNTLLPIKRLIPGTLDDRVIDFIVDKVLNTEKFIVKTGDIVSSTTKKSVMKMAVTEIPQAYLTKQGRLKLSTSWVSIPGNKRFLYSIQDAFKTYLFKQGGMSKLPTDIIDTIHRQAKSNIAKLGQADNYDLYAREFTNLLILNNTKYINEFISGAGFTRWFNSFIRSMDPKVVMETKGVFRHIMNSGYKSVLVGGKSLEKSFFPGTTDRVSQTQQNQSDSQTQQNQSDSQNIKQEPEWNSELLK